MELDSLVFARLNSKCSGWVLNGSWNNDFRICSFCREQAEECIEGDISKADVTDSANLIRVNNEEDKTELKDCEKRSAALLKKELACIQDKSADYIYKV